jgi:hypothetical protein
MPLKQARYHQQVRHAWYHPPSVAAMSDRAPACASYWQSTPTHVSCQLLHQAPLVAVHNSQGGPRPKPLGAQRRSLAPADVHVQVQSEGLAVDARLDGA